MEGSTFCTLPRYTLPISESCWVLDTKCSASTPSSSTPIWIRSSRWRTIIWRSTDSRRARNSASVITWRRRPVSRDSRRRWRLASRRVEPRTLVTLFDTWVSALARGARTRVTVFGGSSCEPPSSSKSTSPRRRRRRRREVTSSLSSSSVAAVSGRCSALALGRAWRTTVWAASGTAKGLIIMMLPCSASSAPVWSSASSTTGCCSLALVSST